MRGKNTLFSAAVILLVLSSPVFAYRQLIDLGVIPDGLSSYALSINDNGQTVGYSYYVNGNQYACVFSTTGANAQSLWGNDSEADSINNAGQIVGRAKFMTGFPPTMHVSDHACLFNSANMSNSKDLGSLGGSISWAYSINNNNQIVGYAYNSAEQPRACLFDFSGNGANKDLGTLGGKNSYAFSINDSGKIVGVANNSSDKSRACLFDSTGSGVNIDLGTLGGGASLAYSINNNNQIVGRASNGSNTHACLFDWTGEGDNIDLGSLGGSTSLAYSINDIGQIVGWSVDSSGNEHACLFDSTGQGNNIDLNTLIDPSSGWALTYAYCINNDGWVVGQGTYNGNTCAFLLTPEPASALLFVMSAALLRRKK